VIVHVVLFEPRGDLTDPEREQLLGDLRLAATSIPTLRRVRIGRRIRHGIPGYEQAMQVDYQYAAIMEFDDRAGLAAYLQHPAHDAAGRHFTRSAAHALAYDYEVTEASASDSAGLLDS
jgi:Stress responsive A/B Barrel Domain